jgi:hypothetical protein
MGARRLLGIGVLAIGVSMIATAPGGAAPPAKARPVIGPARVAPGHPLSGKRLTVTFRVTRSDTHRALTGGALTSAVTIQGNLVAHRQSIARGAARVSLLVPPDAMGKRLVVRIAVTFGGRTARTFAAFSIRRGQALPTISIGDASVPEGDPEGETVLELPVRLSRPDPQPVAFAFTTGDGTATLRDHDYYGGTFIKTIPPRTTTAWISVPITGDWRIEPDESLTVTLSSPVTATIADGSATGTIANDDVVHGGHYAGSLDQGREGGRIAFDVAPDLRSISHIVVQSSPWDCGGSTMLPWPVDLGSFATPIDSTGGGVAFEQSFAIGKATVDVKLNGAFDGHGSGDGGISIHWRGPHGRYGPLDCWNYWQGWDAYTNS